MAATLELVEVTKYYGRVLGVGPFTLSVAPGEFVSLLGPSGCGKSTTLRLIAGLEHPTAGFVRIDGEAVNEKPAHKRNIGLVFQNYALFPHLTVFGNVAFGLRYRQVTSSEARRRVHEALELVDLQGLEDRFPRQLSGGQQQRVALARAVVINPNILLLDEPLSNLDLVLRQRMQGEIKRIQREVGITTVYVTHDQTEAFALSDRVAVLFVGQLHQYAAPDELYEHPVTAEVADFIGETNYLMGHVRSADGRWEFTTERGTRLVLAGTGEVFGPGPGRIAVRPHRVRLADAADGPPRDNVFAASIERLIFAGDVLKAMARLVTGDVIQINTHNLAEHRAQLMRSSVQVELRPEDLQFFPSAAGRAGS